ncbi:MAG: beta strand repeat-containing protein [Leptothrix ochracea]|uniref:beta strand repeat-containing protein n=1 Tax=Leptothrix ochracea TaxID=735331 RepID=UPI0034E228BD
MDGSTTWGAYTAPTIDGAHTVGVREVDAAGNISTSTTLTFTLDTLAPAAPSLVLSGTQNAVSATAPVTNSAIDLVGVEAGATVQYRVYTGATPSAWTSLVAVGGVYTVPSQPTSGLYTVDVQVTDAAGNTSSLSSASFNLQGTPGPVAQLVSDTGIAGDLITSNGALNVPASTTAGLTQVQYSADGTTGWTATAPTWVEGLNTTHLRYVDPNGATPVSLVTTFQFTLDTVAPNVSTSSLTYTPSTLPATQGTLVATVALGANAAVGDTLTLTIANASTQPVARALSAADIAAGSVSITIDQATLVSGTTTSASAHITDVAGNSLPAVVSTALTFDNVAATPTNLALAVDSGVVGDNITNNATLAALVGVETGATVQYSVDGGISWSGTYTPPTVDGQHSVEVRQIDAAGNLSAASTPLVYTLDATTPNVTSVGLSYVASALAATAGTVTATVALGANAAAGDTLTLTVTGASASPVPVVLTTANIQSGTVSFTIDQATLTSGSSYTANAHITDVAGNTSTTVTSAALAFDNVVVAPTGLALATDSGTPGDFLTNNAALAALVGVETGATVEYSLDNGAWGAYTAPTIGDGTLASQHTVAVRQIDAAGNISVASAPLTFTLDTIVATPTISLVTDTGVVGDSITSVATLNAPTGIEAGATVQYSVDGGAWGAAYTVPALDGPHTVSVRQTDVAGNVSTPSTPLAFTLDTVALAPGVKLLADTGVSATDGLTNNAALAPLTGVEPGALVEYNLDNGGWLSSYTPPTANGLHSVIVRQTDVAGNVSLASAPLAFTLDTVAPVALVSGVTGTPGVTLGLLNDTVDPSAFALPGLNVDRITKDPTPAVTPETAGNLVEFSADGLNWFATVQQITHPGGVAVDGAYSLTVRETDAAGNTTTSAPGAYSFTLDTVATAPTLTLDPLTSTTVGGVTYSRNGSFWDAATAALLPSSYTDIHHSTELYSLDAGLSWVDLATTQLNLSTRAAGTGRPTTVWVQQTDAAGNVSPTGTLSFILDNATLAPFVGMASDTGVLNDLTTNNPTFALVATEANSTYFYSFDNVSWTPVTLTPGTSNFGVTLPAVDAAGAAVPAQIASATPFNIWVQQMDIAGNTASFLAAFNVDNFAGAPVVTATNTALTQVASGIAVSDGRLNLGGEVGATFAVSADNGATWVDSSIYTPTTMGANNLLIHQIDAAGNVSANTAFNLNLQGIATTNAATAPAPGPDTASLFTALPHLTLTDTGVSAIDHITNNAGISLTAAQPTLVGDTLSYSVDGGLTWTNNALTPFAPTANAVNTLLIKESYMAGTTMHETPVLPVSFTLDTAAPTSAPTPMYNAAELFTSASGAPSVAVVRVTYNEAVSVNALTATFLGQNTAAGQYTSKVVSSGLSMDSGVSLGVQLDGTTVVELRFTENAGSVGAFTTAQIVPTISLMATDLAGNSAQVPFTVSMTPNLPSFADWTAATLP